MEKPHGLASSASTKWHMSYSALEKHYRTLFHLGHVESMAAWDEATMMPVGGGEARGEALSALRGVIHQQTTHERLSDLFATAAEEVEALSPWQQANMRLMEREWARATALPQDLVETMSRAESRSEQAWRKLGPDNDFADSCHSFAKWCSSSERRHKPWATNWT
jgi:carboxypeptidase Taq